MLGAIPSMGTKFLWGRRRSGPRAGRWLRRVNSSAVLAPTYFIYGWPSDWAPRLGRGEVGLIPTL